jgi:cytochrome c551/c552
MTVKSLKLFVLISILSMMLVSCAKEAAVARTTLADYDTTGKTPQEVAQFVFDNYDCKSCHTLGKDEKFGYTARGEQIRQGSEGCVSLLTGMSVIVHAKEEDRTPEQKQKAAHFQEYGCALCHQVDPGKMSLTAAGQKLASLHLSCSQVQRILNQKARS